MSRVYLAVFVGVVIGIVMAFGALEVFVDSFDFYESNSIDDQEDLHFATRGVYYGNVYTWGINKDKVSSPMRLRELDKHKWVTDSFTKNRSDMADVWWHQLDEVVADKPDTRILPFQVNVPENYTGVYVANNSSIEKPEDLAGKNISAPGRGDPISQPALIMLRDEYNINITQVEGHGLGPEDPLRALDKSHIDAVVVVGTERLSDEMRRGLKPIFFPYKRSEEKFGDSAIPTFFVVKNNSETIEKGFQMIEALKESSKVAQAERDQFMEMYSVCNEFMVRGGVKQIERMSSGSKEQLQYLINISYSQKGLFYEKELSEQKVNISDRLVSQEAR